MIQNEEYLEEMKRGRKREREIEREGGGGRRQMDWKTDKQGRERVIGEYSERKRKTDN